jgi:Tfp pilus assembly protein PilX
VIPLPNRHGFALLIVMVLMAVGSALMVAVINDSIAEDQTARMGTMQRRALVAAESGVWTALGNLVAPAMRAAPLGLVATTTLRTGDMTLIVTVEKVDTSNVWVVASATIQRSGIVARHRVGLSALIPRDTTDLALRPVPERAWAELF